MPVKGEIDQIQLYSIDFNELNENSPKIWHCAKSKARQILVKEVFYWFSMQAINESSKAKFLCKENFPMPGAFAFRRNPFQNVLLRNLCRIPSVKQM